MSPAVAVAPKKRLAPRKSGAKGKRALDETVITISTDERSVAEIETAIRTEVAACEQDLSRGLVHALAAGRDLIKLKDKVDHGKFLPAVERCGLKPRTAQDYMRIARRWPEIEKYAAGAHLTLRDAITGLTRVGAGDMLEDFSEEQLRLPEPQGLLTLPPAWAEPGTLPEAVSAPGPLRAAEQPPQGLLDSQVFSNEDMILKTQRMLVAQLGPKGKVRRALDRTIQEYETAAQCIRALADRRRTMRIDAFVDIDTAFATLAEIHNKVAQAVTVLGMYREAQREEEALQRAAAEEASLPPAPPEVLEVAGAVEAVEP